MKISDFVAKKLTLGKEIKITARDKKTKYKIRKSRYDDSRAILDVEGVFRLKTFYDKSGKSSYIENLILDEDSEDICEEIESRIKELTGFEIINENNDDERFVLLKIYPDQHGMMDVRFSQRIDGEIEKVERDLS